MTHQTISQTIADNPDSVCIFRTPAGYGMYHEHAIIASRQLGLTLRMSESIQWVMFPHHQLDAYLRKLVSLGHRVAVCEQVPA